MVTGILKIIENMNKTLYFVRKKIFTGNKVQEYNANVDTKLDEIEFAECALTEYGLSPRVIRDIFHLVDDDGDGELNLSELTKAKVLLEDIARRLAAELLKVSFCIRIISHDKRGKTYQTVTQSVQMIALKVQKNGII